MKRQDARNNINGRPLTDFVNLEKSRKAGRNMYICPICGSGTGKNGTGAFHIYPDTNRVFCYANGCFTDKGEDTIGALRLIWNCGEAEALERAGYSLDEEKPHQERTANASKAEAPAADYTLFYRECNKALKESPEALEYLHGRGITDDSIERFNLGYCATWKHSKAGERVQPSKRIIIPRTPGTYTARTIEEPRNEWEGQYTKQVQGKQKDLFNLEALDGAATPIICEGELDAISLYQAGAGAVVGIGTTTNAGTFLEEAKKHPEAVYILALDNDKDKPGNPGQTAQKKLAEDMTAAGLDYISTAKLYGEEKDGNAALVKDPERLGKAIAYLEEQAQAMKAARDEEREAELKKRTGEGMLEDFLLTVTNQEARTFEPIPTGIKNIDRALEGGFIRKTLVTLGAPPAMGKTAFAQMIFENMAKAGHDVLYINLEMSREQLLARSISRLAWKYEERDFSALDILRGYEWTKNQREAILRAADRYKTEIAPHFVYNPDGVTNSIDSILKAMEAETARIKAQGKPAPLVCIDYLQLIDSQDRDAIEGLKNVIFLLKDFAKRENTVVFVIIANNRASNKSGVSDMESGRDTSAIEYSGDTMLGISYTAIEDRRKYACGEKSDGTPKFKEYDLDEIRRLKKEAYEAGKATPTICNEVSVKVVKSRFTEADRRANFIFDGKHSTFKQVIKAAGPGTNGTTWEPYQGNETFED